MTINSPIPVIVNGFFQASGACPPVSVFQNSAVSLIISCAASSGSMLKPVYNVQSPPISNKNVMSQPQKTYCETSLTKSAFVSIRTESFLSGSSVVLMIVSLKFSMAEEIMCPKPIAVAAKTSVADQEPPTLKMYTTSAAIPMRAMIVAKTLSIGSSTAS